jgi:lipopolysaccharide/colanic/teichoic acid biosynthesis glycosyltransferase
MRLHKRLFDLLCTVPGVILLAPAMLVVAALIWLDDRGPIFFRQERVGLRGNAFRIWKFRTMVVDAERRGAQFAVGRDPHITRIGAWLRRTKLDELPQLFNLLAGEMSLVGPRPELPHYVNQYTDAQRRVLELTPGITDPASIKYRDEPEVLAQAADPEATYVSEIMPEKIRLSLDYAARASVLRDIGVIVATLANILRARSRPLRERIGTP